MSKLNALVALSVGLKGRTQTEITQLHRKMSHVPGMTGLSRVYRSRDEEGEQLPSETKIVQNRASELLTEALETWKDCWEVVLTQDIANTKACADIIVHEVVLVADVPITTMLWLTKQLDDLHTFVENIPVLDPSQKWEFSKGQNCYATEPNETIRSKKVPCNHVLVAATDKHPAQVQVYQEDVTVGYWSKTDYSGHMTPGIKADLLHRVELVQDAVKEAKEVANGIEVAKQERLNDLFKFLEP